MLQDLVQADSDRVELGLLENQRIEQNMFILKQTQLMTAIQERNDVLADLYSAKSFYADSLEHQIMTMEKDGAKVKRQKKFYMGTSGAFGLILLILLL